MSLRPKTLAILQATPGLAADDALGAALRAAEPELIPLIVETIFARNSAAGLAHLPDVFHELNAAMQATIISRSADLFGALRSAMRSSEVQTRLNVLHIVHRCGNPRLAYIASAAVHDGSTQIRAEAAMTLRELTQNHCTRHDETLACLRQTSDEGVEVQRGIVKTLRLLREERQFLVDALREALAGFESHHRPEVLEAAMLVCEELEGSLFQEGTLRRGKLTHAMMEVLSDSMAPSLAKFVYIALAHPDLRRRIVTVLGLHRGADLFVEMIRDHWLARDPAIRKNLAAIRNIGWLTNGIEPAFTLPEDVAPSAPAWIMALGLPPDQKVSLIAGFLIIDNLPANRAAVWALTRINTASSTRALQSVIDHEDAGLRKTAEREIAYRTRRESKIVRRVVADRPPEWTLLLDQAGISEDFGELWHEFESVHPLHAQSGGPHALKYIAGMATQIQLKLISNNPADRLRALRMVVALGLLERFGREVFNLANDSSAEVRAAAMTALGHIGDATSRRILERAVLQDVPAVQTTAIEALDKIVSPKRVELLTPKLAVDDAQVRAAAVRSMLRMHQPLAAQALVAMLKDDRPDHRCSALWIVDQLKLVALAQRVVEMVESDEDPRIARICQHVSRRLAKLALPSAAPMSVAPASRLVVEGVPA
jgi:multisubunit Na+/H+ antiporter MnhG subunit